MRKEVSESKIIVYRSRFLRLLNFPKPLRDQLILEFPTLNALRTTEVATMEWEHIDLENGDLQVLDSKKLQFLTVPLDYTITKHLEELRARILQKTGSYPSGLLFTPGPKAGRRRPGHMTAQAIEYIWLKWCKASGIPYMSPRYGRAMFAVDWHITQKKSLIGLMDILRHNSLSSTEHYLSKLRAYEDTKVEFYQGMKGPFNSECVRSDKCPMAAPNCYCAGFIPKLEVKQKVLTS